MENKNKGPYRWAVWNHDGDNDKGSQQQAVQIEGRGEVNNEMKGEEVNNPR